MQFGLQLGSSRLADPLAGVLHLEGGHVRVALGGCHPGVAKHLLDDVDDADMHALLDQQGGSGVPGIVNPGVPYPGLAEDVLP